MESKGFMEAEFESVQLPLSTLSLQSTKTPLKLKLSPGEMFNTLRYFANIFAPRKDVSEDDSLYEEFRVYMESHCRRFLNDHGFSHINFSLFLGPANAIQTVQTTNDKENEEGNEAQNEEGEDDEQDSVANTDEENDEI